MRMDERRRITTVRQLELLVEFLDQHRDLALGRVRSKEARSVASRLWRECAEILNAEGPARTAREWAKVWNDNKCRVRAKLIRINTNHRATGGGLNNPIILTGIEEKMANILGRDVGPMPNVSHDQFALEEDVGVADNTHVLEEVIEEVLVHDMQNDSPSILLNINDNEPVQEVATPDIQPSTGHVPPQDRTQRLPRRQQNTLRERRRTQSSNEVLAQPSTSRAALEESRSMILQIEKMKAETALKNAEALSTLAESFKLIAESIDRLSRKYCRQGPENESDK